MEKYARILQRAGEKISGIVVTGASGVIGRRLVPFLREKGYNVIGADVQRISTDLPINVTSYEEVERMFKVANPEIIIHMAGEVGRQWGEEHPERMIEVNDIGTLNVIKMCIKHGTKMVNFSTSEVYGHMFDTGIAVTEDMPLYAMNTTNIYAMSKLFGEDMVKHYVENYGLDAVTIRPFMIYGAGEYPSPYRSAITNMVHNALTGKPLTVHRGAVRAWCYIDDFCSGVELVMKQRMDGYEAYNIGSDEYHHTMMEVALTIISETGQGKIHEIDPPTQFSSLVKIASIEKMKALGYKPVTSLSDGIRKVVEWQRKEVKT